jgi:hypothetical protein
VKIEVQKDFAGTFRWLDQSSRQVQFASAVTLNKVGAQAQSEVVSEERRVFDRPTAWVLNALRLIRASAGRVPLQAVLWFKDRSLFDNAESMIVPHIDGGTRKLKPFEVRLQRIGVLPKSWYAVPGQGADIDANGNMSRGQISLLLNVLGAYTEAGYNKANGKTIARLKAGNAKRGQYGYELIVVPVGSKATSRSGHPLLPGVYKRVSTGFGSSLKPLLIFVRSVRYKKRLDFYGIVQRVVDRDFASDFDAAYADALRTAR